ncbi:MAG: hypothetical protein LBT91_03060 [Bifidobacteriaceae bacterium]|jgi:hypothetical protein|nr:hypothetical protein [Bifidobacteriaceae bacterium]
MKINKTQFFKKFLTKKISVIISILLISIGGIYSSSKSAADETNFKGTLPVAKGGTGRINLGSNSVLLGNNQNSLGITGIDNTFTQNSPNLITSGGIYNSFTQTSIPLADVITLTANFNNSHNNNKAWRFGPFILLQGPIRTTIDLEAGKSYLMGTFQTGYRPYPYVAANCTNNFVENIAAYGGTGRYDCGVSGTYQLLVQNDTDVPSGQYININFLYLVLG